MQHGLEIDGCYQQLQYFLTSGAVLDHNVLTRKSRDVMIKPN